ncbi:hypothetical protein [Pedobacter sp. JCM 36344]|uniref:hypothetical protein n=1 Tax=Pedobacter sp. JCM 36344 TaxID=3374280 RepID=UPI0039795515
MLNSLEPSGKKAITRAKPTPEWERAKLGLTSEGKKVVVVPIAKYVITSDSVDYSRKFVFIEKDGKIVQGNIREVYSTKEYINIKGDVLITDPSELTSPQFTGIFTTYDLNYHILKGKYYKKGKEMKGEVSATKNVLPPTSTKGSQYGIGQQTFDMNNSSISNHSGKKISAFEPIFSGEMSCENYYYVYIERDENGQIVYWGNLGFARQVCTYPTPESPPGGRDIFIDCAGIVDGAAYSSPCGCIGGTTGIGTCTAEIVIDSLKAKFPCVVKVVLSRLLTLNAFRNLSQPFSGFSKPTITYDSKSMSWGQANRYENGITTRSPGSLSGASSTVYLNSHMLNNASEILVAATFIHEIVHANTRYFFAFKEETSPNFFAPDYSNFLQALYAYNLFSLNGDTNFASHYNMMTIQFDKMVNMLVEYGGKVNGVDRYSLQDARKAMLVGMDQLGTNPTLMEANVLGAAYNNLLDRFTISHADMNTYFVSQINAALANKIPINCP